MKLSLAIGMVMAVTLASVIKDAKAQAYLAPESSTTKTIKTNQDIDETFDMWARATNRVLAAPSVERDLKRSLISFGAHDTSMTQSQILSFLDQMPVLSIAVVPSPPRDYRVKINGRSYPATERSEYAVRPGAVNLFVERDGKPPCQWEGDVQASKRIDCPL
jgi:hypothetical protein